MIKITSNKIADEVELIRSFRPISVYVEYFLIKYGRTDTENAKFRCPRTIMTMRSAIVRSKAIMDRAVMGLKRIELLAFFITIIDAFNVNK